MYHPPLGCFAPLAVAAAAASSSSPMMMGLAPAWACGSVGSTLDVACGYAFQLALLAAALALLLCWSNCQPASSAEQTQLGGAPCARAVYC